MGEGRGFKRNRVIPLSWVQVSSQCSLLSVCYTQTKPIPAIGDLQKSLQFFCHPSDCGLHLGCTKKSLNPCLSLSESSLHCYYYLRGADKKMLGANQNKLRIWEGGWRQTGGQCVQEKKVPSTCNVPKACGRAVKSILKKQPQLF